MARLTASIVFLIGWVTLGATAAAQVVTFARDDYASDAGARAMVSADFNRDGWLDVAHANIDRNSVTILLSRRGSGLVRVFEIPVGTGPFDLTTGDFNRDGVPDLAVANADSNTISILLGRGDGSFTRADLAASSQNPRGITTADINTDGHPDLIYTGYTTGAVQVLLGNGGGGFAKGPSHTAAGTQPRGVATGDFNHDGHLDAAVACNNGLRILYGTSGIAVTVRTIAGHRNLNVVAVGDLNNDGWADVAAASTGGSDVSVYLGGASGPTYTRSYVVGASPRGIALGDVNDDGRVDVVTANRASSTVSLLAGDPSHPGTFLAHRQFAAARGSRALVTGDFDGDGRIDLATGNQYTAAVTVLSNVTAFKRAAFSFDALTIPANALLGTPATSGGRFPTSPPRLAVADFNRDGRLDFAATGGPAADPAGVVVMLRDGPTLTLSGPKPLTGFLVDDFNVDGNADVLSYSTDPAAVEQATRFLIFLGDGRGHFAESPTTVEPHSLQSCAAGDLNRDARPDLVCANFVLLGNGTGTFRPGVAFAEEGEQVPPGPLVADVNRDGRLDVIGAAGVYLGDGGGGLVLAASFEGRDFQGRVLAVADLNRDGYVDLITDFGPTDVWLVFGSADGFVRAEPRHTLEGFGAIVIADINMDGKPDIVLNGSTDTESAGILEVLFGNGDGTFTTGAAFLLTLGAAVVADVNGDGLPAVAAFDPHAVHVLVNERNDANQPPVVPDYSFTSGNPCVTLAAKASDADQQALIVEWFDPSGTSIGIGLGNTLDLNICVASPGAYKYRRTASDSQGGIATGTVTFTYRVTMKEIVLYAAADNVEMAGNWARVADPAAAGGFRAYDRNRGTPKVTQPAATPANAITIPFLADPNLTYKLWIRLKADGNSWANDSVWVQFTGAATAPYTAGTTTGLSVSLEECVNCGVSGWGWEDDGFGAVNKNGVLLRFDPGPQSIVIQTREDGVAIDQVVLSAEKYLTMRPGAAKNDRTILPATTAR